AEPASVRSCAEAGSGNSRRKREAKSSARPHRRSQNSVITRSMPSSLKWAKTTCSYPSPVQDPDTAKFGLRCAAAELLVTDRCCQARCCLKAQFRADGKPASGCQMDQMFIYKTRIQCSAMELDK